MTFIRLPRAVSRVALALAFAIPAPLVAPLAAQLAAQRADPGVLSLDRIYGARDFRGQFFGPTQWLNDSTYTAVEPATGGGSQLVRVDAGSGRKSVLVDAATLRPAAGAEPVDIEEYTW